MGGLWFPAYFSPGVPQSPVVQQPAIGVEATRSARLVEFSPEISCLKTRRVKVAVKVELTADKVENVEFYTFLIVNGSPHRPFIISMTPGDTEVITEAAWYVRFNNRDTNEARLKVIYIKAASGNGKRVIAATRNYRIRGRSC